MRAKWGQWGTLEKERLTPVKGGRRREERRERNRGKGRGRKDREQEPE